MAAQFAICTLLTNDGYLPGALALVAALRDLHPRPPIEPEVDFSTVCLVTPETVDVSSIKLLRKVYDVVVGVEILESEDDKGLRLLGRLDLNQVLTKLHVFRLTQYSKVLFLDADVLPVRPLSHLLTLPHDFSAAPDVGWPDIFNSGVMVLTPSQASFGELMRLQKTTGSWDGGDQGLLNEWRGGNWNRLSFTYNTTPTAAYTYAPAYQRYGSTISAIHFIGPNKPWKEIPYRAPGSEAFRQKVEEAQPAYDYSSLVDRWFSIYDRHYRVTAILADHSPRFEVPRYQATWDEGTSLGAEILPSAFTPAGANSWPGLFTSGANPATSLGLYPGPGGPPAAMGAQVAGALGLDDLRRLAVEGMNSVSGPFFVHGGLGEYRSMPLDGRIDLMRPKREPQPLPKESNDQDGSEGDKQGVQSQWHGGEDAHYPPPGGHGDPPPPGGSGASHDSGGHREHQPWSWQGDYSPSHNQDSQGYHAGDGHDNYQRHGANHDVQSSDSEWYPTTNRFLQPSTGSPPRLASLPTPDPRELPAAPRPHLRHLPSSNGHGGHHRQVSPHPNHPSFQAFLEQHSPRAHHHSHSGPLPGPNRHGHGHEHHPHSAHGHRHAAENHRHGSRQDHHHEHPSLQRPQSPPMMVWNPAVDPPPKNSPVPSAFPEDTYFENAWDRQQQHHSPKRSPERSEQASGDTFFHTPVPPHIPETLIQQGHYQNVTGPAPEDRPGHHVQPTPDRSKVKPLFPWEEQPRHIPHRVFPKTDSPPPSAVFVEERKPSTPPPIVPSPPAPAPPTISRRSSQSHALMSPPGVFPGTISFANAWDGVPAIQKYASKLVRPEDRPLMPRPPIPTFDDREYFQNREWEKQAEVGSQDADDEDEDDDDDSPRTRRSRDDDVDLIQEGVQTPRPDSRPSSGRKPSAGRSRSGTGTSSPTQSFLVSRQKKEYREIGVQTDLIDTQTKGVQAFSASQVAPSILRKSGSRTQSASSGIGSARPNLGDFRRESFSRTPSRTGLGFGPVSEDPWRGRVESLPSRRGGIPSFADAGTNALAPPALIRSNSQRTERRMSNPPQPSALQYSPATGGAPAHRTLSPRIMVPPKSFPPMRAPKLSNASSTSATTSILLTPTSARIGPGTLGLGQPNLAALGIGRTTSGASADTTVLSPPESVAPATPFDAMQPFGSTGSHVDHGESVRTGGRVWDPNTGVDVIKRGSEEVLARFLRLNSWEDEEAVTPAAGDGKPLY